MPIFIVLHQGLVDILSTTASDGCHLLGSCRDACDRKARVMPLEKKDRSFQCAFAVPVSQIHKGEDRGGLQARSRFKEIPRRFQLMI